MFSIGEFSKITGLTIKTLRFYHDKGVLVPSHVDPDTGYRRYAASKIEVARVISELRKLEFTIADIAEILGSIEDDGDILEHLQRQKMTVNRKLRKYADISRQLDLIITTEREARSTMQTASYAVEEKRLEPVQIAGVRMRGKYSDCGHGFSQIGRRFGRHICGKPLMLHYDSEYKAEDADFEACMPVSGGASRDGIEVRELPGGPCVALLHQGPYQELGRSYEKVLAYVHERGYEVALPTREVYIKGPGMIFKGNPKKYLTEIQVPVREARVGA